MITPYFSLLSTFFPFFFPCPSFFFSSSTFFFIFFLLHSFLFPFFPFFSLSPSSFFSFFFFILFFQCFFLFFPVFFSLLYYSVLPIAFALSLTIVCLRVAVLPRWAGDHGGERVGTTAHPTRRTTH